MVNLKKTFETIVFRSNILTFFCVTLLIANLVLCSFLFTKHERVILLPPTGHPEFFIVGDQIDENYLSRMARFHSLLLLNKNAWDFLEQSSFLLSSVEDPLKREAFRKALLEEFEKFEKEKLSQTFEIQEILVDSKKKQAMVKGLRRLFTAGSLFLSEDCAFILRYSISKKDGRLSLDSFEKHGEKT